MENLPLVCVNEAIFADMCSVFDMEPANVFRCQKSCMSLYLGKDSLIWIIINSRNGMIALDVGFVRLTSRYLR